MNIIYALLSSSPLLAGICMANAEINLSSVSPTTIRTANTLRAVIRVILVDIPPTANPQLSLDPGELEESASLWPFKMVPTTLSFSPGKISPAEYPPTCEKTTLSK